MNAAWISCYSFLNKNTWQKKTILSKRLHKETLKQDRFPVLDFLIKSSKRDKKKQKLFSKITKNFIMY